MDRVFPHFGWAPMNKERPRHQRRPPRAEKLGKVGKAAFALEAFGFADAMQSAHNAAQIVRGGGQQVALSNVDQQKIKIEEEAEKMHADELVKQFKIEMGVMAPQPSAPAAEKTIGGREGSKTV